MSFVCLKSLLLAQSVQKLDSQIQQLWSGPDWVNVEKIEYTYDDNNQMVTSIDFHWENNAWLQAVKEDVSYDEQGFLVESVTSLWGLDGTEEWTSTFTTRYTYSEEGHLIEELGSQLDDDTLMLSSRTELHYDQNGAILETIESFYSGSTWIPDERISFYYDDMGRLERWDIQSWEQQLDTFDPYLSILLQYDQEGLFYQEINLYKESDVWDTSSIHEFSYDFDYAYDMLVYPYYNAPPNWTETYFHHRVTEVRVMEPMLFAGIPSLSRMSYNYSNSQISTSAAILNAELSTSVFPNPTTGLLNIETEAELTDLTVINSLGQRVLTQPPTKQLDLSDLAPGLYFLVASSESGRHVTKFIKE